MALRLSSLFFLYAVLMVQRSSATKTFLEFYMYQQPVGRRPKGRDCGSWRYICAGTFGYAKASTGGITKVLFAEEALHFAFELYFVTLAVEASVGTGMTYQVELLHMPALPKP